MSAIGIDKDSLPKKCGRCQRPSPASEWITQIQKPTKRFGALIRSALVWQCPDCGNQMSSFIMPGGIF